MDTFRGALEKVFSAYKNLPDDFTYSLGSYLALRYADLRRRTGEPYREYILDVMRDLVDLGLDYHTLLAAALWGIFDLQEDAEREIERYFDSEVAQLAGRVHEILQIEFKTGPESEKFRHLILNLSKDIRVVLIILTERVHVLKYMQKYPVKNPEKYALEARDLLSPLANRLGIRVLKVQLDDLSLKVLNPDEYKYLSDRVEDRRTELASCLENVTRTVREKLESAGIEVEIKSRIKHLTSIHTKMEIQKIPFEKVYDVVGVRIVTPSTPDCYNALGIIHSLWKPIPHRFKDFIAKPKKNMYQSIHTSVMGPHNDFLEVQIRTREMDRNAEYGIAAHWQYKDQPLNKKDSRKFAWLRQIMEWQEEKTDDDNLLNLFKIDLFAEEICVFTPRRDVKILPVNATVLDFAFAIHTDVGLRCHGAKVNGKMVPIRTTLKTGDIAEIITSPRAQPRLDWLKYVNTPNARNRIKRYIREQSKDQLLSVGREGIARHLKKRGVRLQYIMELDIFRDVIRSLGYQNSDDLFVDIGFGKLTAQKIANKLVLSLAKTDKKDSKKAIQKYDIKNHVNIYDNIDIPISFARCCEPLPGEEIVGFITSGRGITIHAKRCHSLKKYPRDRIVGAFWESSDQPSYPVRIVFRSLQHPDTWHRVKKILASHNLALISEKGRILRKGRMQGEIVINIEDIETIRRVMSEIELIPGMVSVDRFLMR